MLVRRLPFLPVTSAAALAATAALLPSPDRASAPVPPAGTPVAVGKAVAAEAARRDPPRRPLAAENAAARTSPGTARRPLRFGIYPWGNVGATDPVAGAHPEVPEHALAAVRDLKGEKTFVVHLYGAYTGTDRDAAGRLLADARWWADHGVQVEMVLRYRPARPDLAPGYAPWVTWVSRRLARISRVTAIQVGNEANSTDAAAAADGAYPGAVRAVARAVPRARRAVVGEGRRDIGIGVNWAAGARPCSGGRFWRSLRRAGGRPFVAAVAWVGVDVYPGTWSRPSRSREPSEAAVGRTVRRTLRCVRREHMPRAGLGRRVSITVAETGYPTDPSRPDALQERVLAATVAATQRVRATYGVTDLRWFSLRDANTPSGQLENGYGLLRSDLSAKPAYWTYRRLIAAGGR